MLGFGLIVSALPFFFFSAFWVMLFWGIVAPWVDIRTIGYMESTTVTFGLWMALASLAVSASKLGKK